MKKLLQSLVAGESLSYEQARDAMHKMLDGSTSDAHAAAFLSVFALRGIKPEELLGFRQALLDLAKPLNCGSEETLDLCGSGGDGKQTFNVSTLTAFVVAAAGVKVAKHGNYAASSLCGSTNLLEALGVPLPDNEDAVRLCLEKVGVVFLHAPLWHPLMKKMASVRKELGFRTIFNLLGPLVNPARPARQCTGVYSEAVQDLYASVLRDAGVCFSLVHAFDGYDEVSLTGRLRLLRNNEEQYLEASDFGLEELKPEALRCPDNIEKIAALSLQLLKSGPDEPRTRVLVANAALAIQTRHPEMSLQDAVLRAKEALYSGAAYEVLEKLKSLKEYEGTEV